MEQTVPKLLRKSAMEWPETVAQFSRKKDGEFEPVTYRELYQKALDFGAGLLSIGIKRGDLIGLISDNRKEWLQADMGIMAIGATDVPRGCDATLLDLEAIFTITETKYIVTENSAQVKKILSIKEKIPFVKEIIVFDEPTEEILAEAKNNGITIYSFAEILKFGQTFRIEHKDEVENELEKGQNSDLACIIFTSGTTGTPKGVMLSHGNFLAQLEELPERIMINPGEKALLVLPVWHVFEREVEYVILIQGGSLCYSKPIGSILLADLKKLNPTLLPAVPRVFEAVYDGIQRKMRKTGGIVNALFKFFTKVAILHSRMHRLMFNQNVCLTRYYTVAWWFAFIIPWSLLWPLKLLGNLLVFRKIKAMLGTNFRAGIAGGGAYPPVLDDFFWAIGVKIVEGYGLTETAPVISVRPIAAPVFGNVGSPIRGVKCRIVDPDDGFVLKRGQFGAVQIKGPTVMQGYYKRPDLTEKTMTVDGWLDTGDLGYLSIHDEIVLKGRKKDTIVLLGGENVEPLPIELKLSESRYIRQAVVVGQDKHYLGALILVEEDEVKNFAAENGIQYDTYENLINSESIQKLFESEISSLINSKNGFKMFERINKFALITKPFEVGVELSAKQEIMRYRLTEIYKDQINKIFADDKN
ncbi:MAG: long-chain fatty acid--CoA ligase [Treponema sp.]|jgi:long-chain acyl-CoA synthetase|nr:long-chain fatty acid--CoA ligase [Treponema sp.]